MKEIQCEKLVTKSIQIVDPNEEVRITLDASPGEGYGCIGLFGKNGAIINISVNPDGSCGLLFQKAGASAAIRPALTPDGEPHIVINKGGILKAIA